MYYQPALINKCCMKDPSHFTPLLNKILFQTIRDYISLKIILMYDSFKIFFNFQTLTLLFLSFSTENVNPNMMIFRTNI